MMPLKPFSGRQKASAICLFLYFCVGLSQLYRKLASLTGGGGSSAIFFNFLYFYFTVFFAFLNVVFSVFFVFLCRHCRNSIENWRL